jgi:hypothetical protein
MSHIKPPVFSVVPLQLPLGLVRKPDATNDDLTFLYLFHAERIFRDHKEDNYGVPSVRNKPCRRLDRREEKTCTPIRIIRIPNR